MLDLQFRARRGEFELDVEISSEAGITVLFGPSGAGKTTILDCVDGSLRPESARLRVEGHAIEDASTSTPRHLRRTPRVFQEGRLFPHLDVAANLRYGHRAGTGPGFDEVVQALEIESLLARNPAQLSGGQRQRVAVGRALLAAPRLLLLDEPLASLDHALRRRILPHLQRWQADFGIPFLYVTHDAEEALLLGGVVVALEAGRVTAQGPAHEILAHPSADLAPTLSGDDTVLRATVLSPTLCGVGDARLWISPTERPIGSTVLVAVSARDIVLARSAPVGLSARNLLPVRVERVAPDAAGIVVDLRWTGAPAETPRLRTRLTLASADELGIAPGVDGVAVVKSAALRLL